MEESPHKCPVCSRSFNQRSNLKTHLLTHTDHKPYECSACGKVFRRNCDLRRHALTHSVGDVPPSDPNLQAEADGDDEYYMARDKRGLSDTDDVDEVLEVDSPDHSPVRRSVSPKTGNDLTIEAPRSNSPCAGSSASHRSFGINKKVSGSHKMIFGRSLDRGDSENEHCDELNVDSFGAVNHHRRIRNDSDRLEALETNSNHSLGGGSSSEVTHCHHEGFIGPHYTMRPHYDYYSPLSFATAAAAQKMSSSSASVSPSAKPTTNNFVHVLHVRRDLHHKSPMISGHPSTITSSVAGNTIAMHDPPGPSFLGSIPVRKRSMGPNGETQLAKPTTTNDGSNNFNPSMRLVASEHHSFGSHHSPSASSSCSQSSQSGGIVKEGALSPIPGSSKDADRTGGAAVVSPTKPPPKKTGFSIEDIMRR